MGELHKLKEMLKKELTQHARRGELSAGSLDAIHKLTDTIKNLDKIEMLEEYGESDESHEGGSYRRGSGGRYERGDSYRGGSYNGNGSYNGGESYKRDRYGRYSRDDGKEEMKRMAQEMMDMAADDRQRDAIRHLMSQLETI